MPAEYKPMTEQSFNKHKTLIYITLTPLMALFSYLANYAMVFRITASVVSYLSVFGTTGWILYQILNKSTTKKNPWTVPYFHQSLYAKQVFHPRNSYTFLSY